MEDEVNKAKFETMGIKFPEELKGLIDEPPLLEGEDPKLYWSLLAAVIDEEKPQGIMDCIDAIDQVNKVWEELRLKRASVGLIRGEMLMALRYFLVPIIGMQETPTLALNYFNKDPKESDVAPAVLSRLNWSLAPEGGPDDEAEAVYGGADHRGFAGARAGYEDSRSMP
jgi:hypothetical protein